MVFKKFFGSKLGVYDWIAVILNLALVESIKEKWLHHGVLCNAQLQSLCYVLFRTYFRTSSSRRLTWKYDPFHFHDFWFAPILSWFLILVRSDFTWRRIGQPISDRHFHYLLTLSLLTRIKTQLRFRVSKPFDITYVK